MGTTNTYGFHYPESTDPPNGAAQMQQLAEDVDTAVAGIDARTSTPAIGWTTIDPISPASDGGLARRICRHVTGQVEIQFGCNLSTSTAGQQVGQLPSWAIPSSELRFAAATTASGSTFNTHVDLHTDGQIVFNAYTPNIGSVGWFMLCATYTP